MSTVAVPDWTRSACAGTDPRLWFAPEGELGQARQRREAKARAICAGCPVAAACLDWALGQPDLAGFWGGVTEDGRKHLRRRMLRRAADAARRAA
jgi:WhiB family redox-sensing transcriptional regulator